MSVGSCWVLFRPVVLLKASFRESTFLDLKFVSVL